MEPRRRGTGGVPADGRRLTAEIFSGLKEEPDEVVDAFFGEEHHEEIVMVATSLSIPAASTISCRFTVGRMSPTCLEAG